MVLMPNLSFRNCIKCRKNHLPQGEVENVLIFDFLGHIYCEIEENAYSVGLFNGNSRNVDVERLSSIHIV